MKVVLIRYKSDELWTVRSLSLISRIPTGVDVDSIGAIWEAAVPMLKPCATVLVRILRRVSSLWASKKDHSITSCSKSASFSIHHCPFSIYTALNIN